MNSPNMPSLQQDKLTLTKAYYNRGNAYASKGDFDQAIDDYTKAIELKPDLVDAYHNRGIAYDKQGDYDQCY